MAVYAEIKDIVENVGKKTKFLQPMYEAIVNSFEANASNIILNFTAENCLFGYGPITGFSIEDDGDGFDQKNRDAFAMLWTDNKRKQGCKGSGRFTWLSVYDKIEIISYIQNEQMQVSILFDYNYSKEKNMIFPCKVEKNKTIISFSGVNERFIRKNKKGKIIDDRDIADPKKLKQQILDYLMIKLFLMKKNHKEFNIIIKCNNEIETITQKDIPQLLSKSFYIYSELIDENIYFDLYYYFMSDSKNSKKMFLCANERSIQTIDDDSLGFSAGLPNQDSFIMLLCSDYFEGKDNDSRSDLEQLSYLKSPNYEVPLLIGDIKKVAKKTMAEIIFEKYPQINEINQAAIDEAINEAPHLADYINSNKELIKSAAALITVANKQFQNEKITVKTKFEQILQRHSIDTKEFNETINRVNSIAAAELGEYILFRDNIIKALEKSIYDVDTKEKIVHDIFMPMHTMSKQKDEDKHLLSNLWLIDDKFMTYSFCASDISVNRICDAIESKNKVTYKTSHRPDLSIFFNRNDKEKDVIMVEFKGPNASKDEKNKSLTELPNDISIVRKNIEGIRTIWSYIITTIDDDFADSIENSEDYTRLFSDNSTNRSYYRYLKRNNAHVFIIDLKTIVSDAFARNKTFLDILKK